MRRFAARSFTSPPGGCGCIRSAAGRPAAARASCAPRVTTRRLDEALDSRARKPALSALSCARSLPSRSSCDVELEHEHVHGDDTRRAARRRPRSRPRRRRGAVATTRASCAGAGGATRLRQRPRPWSRQTFTAARSLADAARGLASISRAEGRTGFVVRMRSSGCLPQMQTGKSGGHVQPRARCLEEPLHDPVLERVEADHGEPAARP